MNKRLVIKTSLICFGIFMMISAIALWIINGKVVTAEENTIEVFVALKRIDKGTIITENMIVKKSIPSDIKNNYMMDDLEMVVGQKTMAATEAGDYIRKYDLLSKENWYSDDDRITVLPMEVEERMANLIIRDSFIDIKMVPKTGRSLPRTVLSKIRVDDVIDENGVSLGNTGVNKKAYVKVVLSKEQRDKLFAARELGRFIYELYCDDGQNSPKEEFKIPDEFL